MARLSGFAATVTLEQAVKLDSNLALAQNQFGLLNLQEGKLAEAEKLYRQVLATQPDGARAQVNPGYAQAHNNLGYLLLIIST